MRRTLLLALAGSTLLTACGPASHLDLQLRSVGVTVPRIVTPAVTIVPPATAPVPAPLPPIPPVTSFLPTPAAPATAPLPVAPAAAPCPKADAFAVPAVPGTPLIAGYPAAASFRQRASGSSSQAGAQKPITGEVSVRVVRLPGSSTSVGQKVDSWRVERRSAEGTSVEVYDLVHSSTADAAISPGIYLVGLAWDDPIRGRVTFQPAGNGLFVLPNPVEVAQQVQGVAVQYAGSATDPQTLTTLSLARTVNGRQRVDLCGKVVDTYTVAMSGALVTRDARWQVSWTQQLATAYGGIDVASTLALSSPATGVSWTRTLTSTTVPAAGS